jgi:GntR family transcriptional regulator of arabinose operon
VPKYAELAQRLLAEIARANLQPGDRLATEVELAQQYGVSRPTVRHALALLQREGYISRKKKSGTFVRRAVSVGEGPPTRSRSIVLVCSDGRAAHPEGDFAFLNALRLIEKRLGERGYALQVLGLGSNEGFSRERVQQLSQRKDLDGFIAMGPCADPYQDLLPRLPIVQFSVWHSGTLPSVGADITANCREAIEYLLDYGHRDISLICGPWLDSQAFALFANGYRDAFGARHLPYHRTLLVQAYAGEPLVNLARDVLRGSVRPTAIFAENWKICEAVLVAAEELGLAIPDDLSLIAYGENCLRIRSPVPITTYLPDCETEVNRLIDLLESLIENRPVRDRHPRCKGRLLTRQSVQQVEPSCRPESPARSG